MASGKGFFSRLEARDGWFGNLGQRPGWFDERLIDSAAAAGIIAKVSWVQFEIPAAAAAGGVVLKYWTGSAWVEKPLKRWNGSAWVAATLKRYTGSAWA